MQWILIIPHWVILHTVGNVFASITTVVAWVIVLTTGKLPAGIDTFHSTCVRYRARMFSYMWCLTDKYPLYRLFTFAVGVEV